MLLRTFGNLKNKFWSHLKEHARIPKMNDSEKLSETNLQASRSHTAPPISCLAASQEEAVEYDQDAADIPSEFKIKPARNGHCTVPI